MAFFASLQYKKIQLAGNPITVNADAVILDPVDADRRGLRYYCEVYLQTAFQSTDFEKIATLEMREEPVKPGAVISEGAFFDIQTRLSSALKAAAPANLIDRFFTCADMVRAYYCKIRVNNESEEIAAYDTVTQFVTIGGISTEDFGQYTDTYFTNHVGKVSGFKFLTNQPDMKLIGTSQAEFLYFITNFTPLPSAFKLKRSFKHLNGSVTADAPAVFSGISNMTGYAVRVNGEIPDTATRMAVWLENDADEIISETRTYLIDRTYYDKEQFMLFRNGLGGYDTLRMTGDYETSMKTDHKQYEQWNGWDARLPRTKRVVDSVTATAELKVTVMPLRIRHLKWLNDFAMSRDFLLLTEKGFRSYTPGFDAYTDRMTTEQAAGRTFTFKAATDELAYSNLPVNTAPERETAWRIYASSCELDAFGKRTGRLVVNALRKYYIDDTTDVKPAQVKNNVPGTDGYVEPVTTEDCAVITTPFLSAGISRLSSFIKAGCATGLVGTSPTIIIAAGKYGSELSQEDADAKAEAEYISLNTQAYANANGACVVPPNGIGVSFYAYETGSVPPPTVFDGVPIATRVDSQINYLPAFGDVFGIGRAEYFAARWQGFIIGPYSGTVTLSIYHDDGFRLWLDDVLIGNVWTTVSPNLLEITVNMVKNRKYAFKLEYYNQIGSIRTMVRWRYSGQSEIVVPNANYLQI